MKHYLINTETLEIATEPVGGNPVLRRRGELPEINEGIPEPWAYVPDLPRPEIDTDTQTYDGRVVTLDGYGWRFRDLTPDEIEARKPGVQPITKLTLMNRLHAMEKWDTFKAILAQAPAIVQDSWTLAQDIRSDDPLFVANAEGFRAALELTEDEFHQLLTL
jgi:hypothetical protein